MSSTVLRARLDKINSVLATGLTSMTTDGQSVSVDLDQLRREKQSIEEQLGRRPRRRRVFGFNMGGR